MKKKHGVFFGFAVLMIAAIFTLTGCEHDPGDDGIIRISTDEQFNAIRNQLDGHYVLEADIDLASYENFVSIGTFEPLSDVPEDEETPKLELTFTGVFDGNGHTISNVTIDAPTGGGVGLFGCVAGENGLVKNLVVENVSVIGFLMVGGVIGYKSSVKTFENITLQGTNSITGTKMVGGIFGGGWGDIKNSRAIADITLNENGSFAGILAGGMADSSIVSCAVTGGSITAVAGSMAIGGLAACACASAEVKDCTVSNVTITVGADSFMIGGLLGYAGTDAPAIPTAISNCTVSNVTISAPASAERIGGIVGSGFYTSAYAAYATTPGYEYFGAPNAFSVTNSSTSGSITGNCTDLVGKIAGYIYDNSTVDGTCTSTMTGASNNVGGDKDSTALSTLK
jgi:hypothetical protein